MTHLVKSGQKQWRMGLKLREWVGKGWFGAGGMFVRGYRNLSELIRTNRRVSDFL